MTAGTSPRETNVPLTLSDFAVLLAATTRWSDNDMYGHLNNAAYYQLFDAAINRWLIAETDFDPVTAPVRGVVIESSCRFFRSVAFPDELSVGIRVDHIGGSSVRYTLGVFSGVSQSANNAPAAAVATWTHVYVDREGHAVQMPTSIRTLLERSMQGPEEARHA